MRMHIYMNGDSTRIVYANVRPDRRPWRGQLMQYAESVLIRF